MSSDRNPFQLRFWSTVKWPMREGLLILLGAPAGFFVLGFLHGGLLYGLISAAIIFPVVLLLWVLHRLLKAWTEWPTRSRLLFWLKAAVRFLLTDS